MDIEEIKDFVYEVRTFGITSNDTKFVQITEYLLSELEKEKEKNKEAKNLLIDMVNQFAYEDNNPKTRGSSEQKIYTAGLSTLEDAFYLLDIDEGIKREDLWKLKEE